MYESDFFRNRLTHSLEVAQIAEGIADRLNAVTPELLELPTEQRINPKVCVTASLIHDLGHPPFGHNGEKALDKCMRAYGGFEGNAQSLRIVSCLEKKVVHSGHRMGLDLCYRTLASALKYNKEIPYSRRPDEKKPTKGYYGTESDLVQQIKDAVTGIAHFPEDFKTVECSIMDIADDIAYSTYDLEDCMKAGFLTPASILTSGSNIIDRVANDVTSQLRRGISSEKVLKVFQEIFEGVSADAATGSDTLLGFSYRYRAYEQIAENSYFRTKLSSALVGKAIESCTLKYNARFPALSEVHLSEEVQERVEILKQYTFNAMIYSSRVKVPEYRGYAVVKGIFEALANEKGDVLMPDDVRSWYADARGDLGRQMRVVSDFVAGMTDRYAMEFYGRLHSDTAQSMFKPL